MSAHMAVANSTHHGSDESSAAGNTDVKPRMPESLLHGPEPVRFVFGVLAFGRDP